MICIKCLYSLYKSVSIKRHPPGIEGKSEKKQQNKNEQVYVGKIMTIKTRRV